MDDRRGVQCELEGDAATEGVANDVRPRHTQVAQQRPTVGGLAPDTDGAGGAAAARVAAAVVGDEPVPLGQGGLGQQRPERVGDERAVDENHRLADARDLVLERDAVDDRSPHAPSWVGGAIRCPRRPPSAGAASGSARPGLSRCLRASPAAVTLAAPLADEALAPDDAATAGEPLDAVIVRVRDVDAAARTNGRRL